MERNCDVCGVSYMAVRANSKTCSDRCRTRRRRGSTVEKVAEKPTPIPQSDDGLVAVTRQRLVDAERLATVDGQRALLLAERIASRSEPGNSVASLSKEFSVVMDRALEGANVAADPVDELRERRDLKRAAG